MSEPKLFTVSQVNARIEGLVGTDPMLANLSVEGEVSNCNYNQSGHIYFTLKDARSAISCVMFAGKRAYGLRFPMKNGDKVVVSGYVGIYAPSGRYQVYAAKIELAGVGNLYQRFEELKKQLAAEGLFDPAHKKPLPSHAMRIGVVTAPTGAAVHDIIRVSHLRNPYVQLVLYPAVVQGDAAPQSLVAGIAMLDAMGLDAIIVGRGGGSLEDLWAFNDERVARAIFAARTPIVSAVGHETDVTIADFVADVRAATPSQAAELANFVFDDFRRSLVRFADRLDRAMDFRLDVASRKAEALHARLLSLRPDNRLQAKAEKLEALRGRLNMLMTMRLDRLQARLQSLAAKLDGLSPAKKLQHGFGYVTDANGLRVDSVAQLRIGDSLSVRLADGVVESTVTSISSPSSPSPSPIKPIKPINPINPINPLRPPSASTPNN
ncbi:MAG: exodeoxyribonuclease VII large subunit [Bacteroidales bacterium]|nr:exodeoxyribonuclease VII large subunit [Bacteroidales bacterium]